MESPFSPQRTSDRGHYLNDAERLAYRLGLIDLGHYPAQQKSAQPRERGRFDRQAFVVVQWKGS
jgi:hypothetical protein